MYKKFVMLICLFKIPEKTVKGYTEKTKGSLAFGKGLPISMAKIKARGKLQYGKDNLNIM